MKQAIVFLRGVKVGILTEDENGYTFEYDANYLTSANAEAVSLTLPLSDKPYRDKVLFPFFDGLIPEGWLLDIAEKNWKIDARDRMSLLVACCKDCIGAGSCDGSCGIETGNATIDISCSGNNALAVGSLCGYTNIKADGTTFLIRSLGERAGCIGSLAALDGSTPSRINIKNSTLNLSLNALCGSAVGCRKTACDTVISDSDITVHVEGDAVAGIGSAEGKGSLLIKNSDIKSSSTSGVYSLEIGFMNKGCIINNSTINSHLINDPDYHDPSRLLQQN